jgi:hypothetical protein
MVFGTGSVDISRPTIIDLVFYSASCKLYWINMNNI